MGNAIEKTKNLKRVFIPVEKIHVNPLNPNEMGDKEFNLLYQNIEEMGITDPLLVVPHPSIDGEFMLIGGEHRFTVAKLQGFSEVPCTVDERSDFDEDAQKFQIVRHNIIHGKMSPKKFVALYESLSKEYTSEVAAEMFGFVEEEEFKRLIQQTKASLPKEMQKAFSDGAKEIKTIEELSVLLNTLFAKYGDTLDYNYMVIDVAGKDSLWLRTDNIGYKKVLEFCEQCRRNNRAVDDAFVELMHRVGKDEEWFKKLMEDVPEREIPEEVKLPTLDFLDEL